MTIDSGYAPEVSNINAAREYPFTFQHIGSETIVVQEINGAGDVTLIPPTSYTITGIGGDGPVYTGGTVTFTELHGLDTVQVRISRVTAASQLTTYPAYGPFPAEVNEFAHDKAMMIIQELQSQGLIVTGGGGGTPGTGLPANTRNFATLSGSLAGWYENVWVLNGNHELTGGFVAPTDALDSGVAFYGNALGGGIYPITNGVLDLASPLISLLTGTGAVGISFGGAERMRSQSDGMQINGRLKGMTDGGDPADAVTKQQLDAAVGGGLTPGLVDNSILGWDNTGGQWVEIPDVLALADGGNGVIAAVVSGAGTGLVANALGGTLQQMVAGLPSGEQVLSWLVGGATSLLHAGNAAVSTTATGMNVDATNGVISGLDGTPTLADHAINKAYFDANNTGLPAATVHGSIPVWDTSGDPDQWVAQAQVLALTDVNNNGYVAATGPAQSGWALLGNGNLGALYPIVNGAPDAVGSEIIGWDRAAGLNIKHPGTNAVKLQMLSTGVSVIGDVSATDDLIAGDTVFADGVLASRDGAGDGSVLNSNGVYGEISDLANNGLGGRIAMSWNSFSWNFDQDVQRAHGDLLVDGSLGTPSDRVQGGYFDDAVYYSGFTANGPVYSNLGFLTSTNPSDARLKEDVVDLDMGLADIMSLRPVSFTWKGDGNYDYGFIAQEVEEVVPDMVAIENDQYGLKSHMLVPMLVKAVQDLTRKVEELEARL
jgi:hypothetical protein